MSLHAYAPRVVIKHAKADLTAVNRLSFLGAAAMEQVRAAYALASAPMRRQAGCGVSVATWQRLRGVLAPKPVSPKASKIVSGHRIVYAAVIMQLEAYQTRTPATSSIEPK